MAKLRNVKMIICDMAGTIIQERGIVYQVLHKSIQRFDPKVTLSNLSRFHGYPKKEVINYFVKKSNVRNKESTLETSYDWFKQTLHKEYRTNKGVTLIHPKLPWLLDDIRSQGIKVCLNTGYDKETKDLLIDRFDLDWVITDSISSDQVLFGRPEPYMIHKLANRHGIKNRYHIVKIGDTYTDIMEGHNAETRTIGVLTGADTQCVLELANPTRILNSIMDITTLIE